MPAVNCQPPEPLPGAEGAAAELIAARHELKELRAALAEQIATTERIQQELGLRNAALDAATTHFMIVDAQQPGLPIVYANHALAEQHGYESSQFLIGQGVSIFSGAYLRSEDQQKYDQALAEGRAARVEMEITRRDGARFLVGLSTTPLRNAQGQVTHYVTLGADITVRRENERKKQQLQEQLYAEMRERERMAIELRLAQKLESVGRLAAGLAHEINTPIQYVCDSVHFLQSAFTDINALFQAHRTAVATLAGIKGTQQITAGLSELEAASDLEFLSQEVPKAFERTLEGADRVAGLVRAMKEFAYPDANEHNAADLNHALATTLTVARGEYKYAACVETRFGELPPVICNVSELNQVFLNLIVNAAHAIHDSGKDASTGRITVSTRVLGDAAEIVITDNGCGIPTENLDKIFDPFYTTKEVGRGTGQGLAIARAIVIDKHDGRIHVDSTPGAGTRFTLHLPLQGRKCRQAV